MATYKVKVEKRVTETHLVHAGSEEVAMLVAKVNAVHLRPLDSEPPIYEALSAKVLTSEELEELKG